MHTIVGFKSHANPRRFKRLLYVAARVNLRKFGIHTSKEAFRSARSMSKRDRLRVRNFETSL